MTTGSEDRFIDGVVDQLDHVESGRVLDRDARWAIVSLAVVGLSLAASAWWSSGPTSVRIAPNEVDPGITPAEVEGAIRRLRIQTPETDPTPDPLPGATPAGVERYQRIDAIAPGRRS
ncbi:MAG: hypothetical protein VX672_07860 [Planctomycetota bacterium]|nr:hypothetical protein [Planctomycetota bacterium]